MVSCWFESQPDNTDKAGASRFRLHRGGQMILNLCRSIAFLFLLASVGLAQGTLDDYERARQFLPGNLQHSTYVAEVAPHWIHKANRF
jgi:hypothetical protein